MPSHRPRRVGRAAASLVCALALTVSACAEQAGAPLGPELHLDAARDGAVVNADVVVRTEVRDPATGRRLVTQTPTRLTGRVVGGDARLTGFLGDGPDRQAVGLRVFRSGPTEPRVDEVTDEAGAAWRLERSVDASGTRVTVRAFRDGELTTVLRFRYSRADGGRLMTARTEQYVAGELTQALDVAVGALVRDEHAEAVATVASLVRRLGTAPVAFLAPREAHAATAASCFYLALKLLGSAAAAGTVCGAAVTGSILTAGATAPPGALACGATGLALLDAFHDYHSECTAQT